MNISKVWYVTGASQGLGLILVKKLQTLSAFGRIDVVVKNAGYGLAGTIEETPDHDIRNIFDVNVLATIDVVKKVLPVMRNQRSGYIINIGSVAGFAGPPGWSVYSSTKAAVAAFSEVIAQDVREFGIKVTIAEPSGFCTKQVASQEHAFPDGREGTIIVELQSLGGQTKLLKIADDGVGIPPSVDENNPNSFGLRLIRGFTSDLLGTLKIERSGGTSIEIVFPENAL